jgi:hypothetical protein
MKTLRHAATLVLAAALASSAGAQQQGKGDNLRDGTPTGSLGHPLGEYLTIEGVTPDQALKVRSYLIVSKVNGKALPEKVGISIEGFESDDFPRRTRCVLKGYETGRMVGQPPAVVAAAKEAGQPIPPGPAASWHFSRHFEVLSVVSPAEPTKKKTKD